MGKVKENAQRAVILMAVVGFAFSSVVGVIVYFLQAQNQTSEQTEQQKILEQLQEQNKETSMNNQPLEGYSAEPFDASSVTGLKVETLKEGDGAVANASSTVSANYFGWTSDGKIFDSSNKNGVATPIDFPLSGVISGWTEGLTNVKAGSVVKLIIPAEQAYGAEDKGDGRPFGPLAFIVELKEVK